MKKIVLSLLVIVAFVITSCEKEVENKSNYSSIKQEKSQWVNPYDEENMVIVEGLQSFFDEASSWSCDEFPEYDEFEFLLLQSVDAFQYNEEYVIYEDEEELTSIYLDWLCFYNEQDDISLVEVLEYTQSQILNNTQIPSTEKQKILYNISVLRMALDGLMYACASNEDEFDDCMRDRLRAIESNPVSGALFIIGVPWSFIKLVAECVYEVSFANSAQ